MKNVKYVLAFLLIGLVTFALIFVCGNSYDFYTRESKVEIGSETLNVSISKPNDYVGLDVIVVVHGDGALDASANGAYYPVFETMTNKGYAVVSWDKPGVGKSSGNWLNQSMDDRAREVLDIIQFIKSLDEFKNSKIGLWGSSQAGWVIPKIANNPDIDFTILCAPAVDWIEQARYHIEKKMMNENASESEISQELEKFDHSLKYFIDDYSYEAYVEETGDSSLSRERYGFIKKNVLSNSTNELENFHTPLLLLLGGKDINVDTHNTKNVYEKHVSSDVLKIKWIEDTNHSFIKPKYINNKLLLKATFVLSPHKIIHPELLRAIMEFLE